MIRHSSRPVATVAMLLALAACRGETTAPNEGAGGARSAGQAAPRDTAGSGGTAPAAPTPAAPAPGPSDTARTTPPAPAATAIELTVYVGIASPGPDTLHSTPAANARVAVLSRTFTRSSGPDTLTVTEALVASGTTDDLGKVSFGSLPSAHYRIEAVVNGGPGLPTSIQIAPPYASNVATSIIIRPAS